MHSPLQTNILDLCLKCDTKGQLRTKMSDKRYISVTSSNCVSSVSFIYFYFNPVNFCVNSLKPLIYLFSLQAFAVVELRLWSYRK